MSAPTSFWARRKAAVQAEAEADAAKARAEAEAAELDAIAAAQAEKTDAELLADLGLPDPDTLAMGDDFAAFMGRAVPEHLRRRALRKLWVSNPVLANLDGLVDHGEDYTDAATVIPGMQTAYQVGKGMMQHVIALAEKAAAKAEAENTPNTPQIEVVSESASDIMDPEEGAEEVATDRTPHDYAKAETEVVPTPRRHMRFEFAS